MQVTRARQGSFTVSAKVLPILQICRITKSVWDVVSWHLQLRHLSESQRAAIAAKLANMQSGRRTDIQPRANLHEVSIPEAASLLNVSERSVKSAKESRTGRHTRP